MPLRLFPILALLLLMGLHAQAREIWLPVPNSSVIIDSKIQTPEGLGYGIDGSSVVRSKDGLHWDLTGNYPGIYDLYSLGRRNRRLVVIGDASWLESTPSAPLAASVSKDGGKTWSPVVHNYNISAWNSRATSPMLVFRQQFFVALSTNQIIRSDNGLRWTKAASLSDPVGMAASTQLLVAVGADGVVRTTSDGVSWQSRRLPHKAISIAYGNGLFIAVTGAPWDFKYKTQRHRILYASTDGLTWREVLRDGTSSLNTISYTNGRWIAAGQTGVRTSFTGRIWSQTPILDLTDIISRSHTTGAMTFRGRTYISTLFYDALVGPHEILYRKVNDIRAPLIGHFNQKLLKPGVLSLEGRVRDDSYYLHLPSVRVRVRRSDATTWSRWTKASVYLDYSASNPVTAWRADIALPGPGPHMIQIKATDAAGNMSLRNATVRP